MAARRLGLTLAQFEVVRARLEARGFPKPDPDTGHYDLAAVDRWCDARNPQLFGLTAIPTARDARTFCGDRLARFSGG